jgi:hypothetical protein
MHDGNKFKCILSKTFLYPLQANNSVVVNVDAESDNVNDDDDDNDKDDDDRPLLPPLDDDQIDGDLQQPFVNVSENRVKTLASSDSSDSIDKNEKTMRRSGNNDVAASKDSIELERDEIADTLAKLDPLVLRRKALPPVDFGFTNRQFYNPISYLGGPRIKNQQAGEGGDGSTSNRNSVTSVLSIDE